MKGDFSRITFRPEKRYRKVKIQQGRVQIDADFNEQVDIENYHNRVSLSDIIGNHGVPLDQKDGFRIEPMGNSYLIKRGRYYVDGIVCENENFLDYQKAITSLLIENTNSLKNSVEELSQKKLQSEIIFNSKLLERDGEINNIGKEFDSIRSHFWNLISIVG